MVNLVKAVLKPITAAIAAILISTCNEGCMPRLAPNADAMDKSYQDELISCVQKSNTPEESRLCRKAVDERHGVCDHPEWPRIGRCD